MTPGFQECWLLALKKQSLTRKHKHYPIDYSCDNRRFWLSAHNCQVPTPNFSKPRTRTANSDFWSRLTHQLLGRLRFTIPNMQIYLPKKANFEKLGFGFDNPCKIDFFEFADEQVESFSLQLRNDTKMSPQLKSFFHRHIYSLHNILHGLSITNPNFSNFCILANKSAN
jgi:hypothetical protein